MNWRLRVHEQLASTSDLCIALAQSGEPEGLAVLARRQTAGRGSRGRAWQTLEGNLALSVLVRPGDAAGDAGKWALLGAVALHGALRAHAAVTLKWPNDVLLGGAKVGGVLIDAASGARGLEWLVLGFGANLASAPSGATGPGGRPHPGPLPHAGEGEARALGAIDPLVIGRAILDQISSLRALWRARTFAPLREAWLAAAHPPGTRLRVRAGGTDATGAFAGLSEDGALLLATAGETRRFSTGEVLLGC